MACSQNTQEAGDPAMGRGQSTQELADRGRELVSQEGDVIGERRPFDRKSRSLPFGANSPEAITPLRVSSSSKDFAIMTILILLYERDG